MSIEKRLTATAVFLQTLGRVVDGLGAAFPRAIEAIKGDLRHERERDEDELKSLIRANTEIISNQRADIRGLETAARVGGAVAGLIVGGIVSVGVSILVALLMRGH